MNNENETESRVSQINTLDVLDAILYSLYELEQEVQEQNYETLPDILKELRGRVDELRLILSNNE